MAPRKMTMGVDARVWCLSRFIHPSALIRAKFPNPVRGHKLDDMIEATRGENHQSEAGVGHCLHT